MSMPEDPDSPDRRRKYSFTFPPQAHQTAKDQADVLLYPVRESEIPELARIYMKAYKGMEEYGEANTDQALLYLQRLNRFCSKGIFKTMVNGRTAGFIVCDPHWYEPGQRKVLEIHELVVDPDYQGYGLGSLLMRFAYSMGRKYGRPVVSLWAGEGNSRAIGWYTRKYGFKPDRKDGVWIHFQTRIEPWNSQ